MHRASARHISVFDWVLLPGKPKPVDEEEQVRPEQPLRQLPRLAWGRRRPGAGLPPACRKCMVNYKTLL